MAPAMRDAAGYQHARVQQTLRGVRVLGGEAIVHLRQDGTPAGTTDHLYRNVKVPSITPRIANTQAIASAEANVNCPGCFRTDKSADLVVLPQGEDFRLAYQVKLRRDDGRGMAMPVVIVDAQSGAVISKYDNLQTATGPTLYDGTVNLVTNGKYLEDATKRHAVFDSSKGGYERFKSDEDSWNDKAANQAHFGTGKVLEYFKTVHGRDGIDGTGGPGTQSSSDGSLRLLTSRVHYGTRYANAFWNGREMTYGDGDGSMFGPLMTLDICGHEITHGIVERTAGLIYQGESGALNESWADVFGTLVERFVRGENANTWLLGEDAYTPGKAGDALRYMDEPTRAGHPDHYSDRYTGLGDNGGVHTNSGISNKAFYLVAKGGTHKKGGSMTGIGADAAAKIWYLALTSFMTERTNFAGARAATLQAAEELHGKTSAQYNAVKQAWDLVGVRDAPPGPTNVELVENGTFESSAAPWMLNGLAWWTDSGSNAHSGSGYVYMGGKDETVGSIFADIDIPANAASAALTFALHVQSTETEGTKDRLIVEVMDPNGGVLLPIGTYSNADKSSGYAIKGPFDLRAYKGRTIRLRFRATTDARNPTTFRIDSVSIK
jgi:thermolysin